MTKRCALAAVLGLLAIPASAGARPATRSFDLVAGKEEFVRAWLKAVATDDPSVATAELLSSNEVLLTALKPGRTLLLLVGETNMDGVRLRIAAPGGKPPEVHATPEQLAAAQKACPGFKEEGRPEEKTVTVAVSSAGCRAALRELFEADEYSTRRVELSFAPEALLDQLNAIRAALKGARLDSIEVAYAGVTAVLKGRATATQRMEAMKILFAQTVGPVLFEDQTEVVEEPKKAVAPQPQPLPEVVDFPAADAGTAPKPGAKKK